MLSITVNPEKTQISRAKQLTLGSRSHATSWEYSPGEEHSAEDPVVFQGTPPSLLLFYKQCCTNMLHILIADPSHPRVSLWVLISGMECFVRHGRNDTANREGAVSIQLTH